MADLYNKKIVGISQNLRKSMTKEEKHLWYDFLKDLPLTFKRQKVFGNYIVDFYCDKAKVIIELDGSQHYDESAISKDKIRDGFFESLGIKVLRYSNHDVNYHFDAVCDDIKAFLVMRLSPPHQSADADSFSTGEKPLVSSNISAFSLVEKGDRESGG